MINNVDLVISYRSTQSSSGSGYYRSRGSKDYPLMLIIMTLELTRLVN